jgi:hypothetical protein
MPPATDVTLPEKTDVIEPHVEEDAANVLSFTSLLLSM